jgi:hypothetical protein
MILALFKIIAGYSCQVLHRGYWQVAQLLCLLHQVTKELLWRWQCRQQENLVTTVKLYDHTSWISEALVLLATSRLYLVTAPDIAESKWMYQSFISLHTIFLTWKMNSAVLIISIAIIVAMPLQHHTQTVNQSKIGINKIAAPSAWPANVNTL